jgi:hypothetical protein
MQHVKKELAIKLYGEAKILSSQCKFPECISVLQKAIYYDPANIETRSFLSQIYMCSGCYYQAYYNLLTICSPNATEFHYSPEKDKEFRLIIKAACKTAKFDIAKSLLSVAGDSNLQDFVQKEEKTFETLVNDRMKVYGENKEIRKMLTSGLIIECKIPHLRENKRNPIEVRSFADNALVGKNIELKQIGDCCYGLFAKKSFSVDEIVFEETPYAIVNGDVSNRCYHCCQFIVVKIKCSNKKCNMLFCSEHCQNEAHKEYHAPLCGLNIASFVEMVMVGKTSTSRLPLLCWKILGKALTNDSLDRYPSQYGNLSLLYRHSSKEDYMMPSSGVRLYEHFRSALMGTRYEHEPYLGVEWIIDCYEMLLLNAISLRSNESSSILTENQALLSIGSFFNHSDRPNCSWSEEIDPLNKNTKAVFKATRAIKENEQIFISYGDDKAALEYIHKIS